MARETLTKPGLAIEDTERLAQDELRRLRALPLWQVRLRLLGRSLAAQWRLFAEQPIGLIGLGVIICFGLLALIISDEDAAALQSSDEEISVALDRAIDDAINKILAERRLTTA